MRRGRSGPIAVETKIGWILSGPVDLRVSATNLTACHTHTLKIETHLVGEERLDDQLRRFWELESLSVADKESSVYDEFVQRTSFDGERY